MRDGVCTDIKVTPAVVKSHMRVFVNCLIRNPAFDSQSKDRLVTPASDFGFAIRITDRLVRQVAAAGVEHAVVNALRAKDSAVRAVQAYMHDGTTTTTRSSHDPARPTRRYSG